jgi:hypothetical protein
MTTVIFKKKIAINNGRCGRVIDPALPNFQASNLNRSEGLAILGQLIASRTPNL